MKYIAFAIRRENMCFCVSTDYLTLRMNSNANHEAWTFNDMMWQQTFINGHKHIPQVGGVDDKGGYTLVQEGAMWTTTLLYKKTACSNTDIKTMCTLSVMFTVFLWQWTWKMKSKVRCESHWLWTEQTERAFLSLLVPRADSPGKLKVIGSLR